MDAASARIHLRHDLDRATGYSRALQRTIEFYRQYVVEILSCDERHHHVAREKLDVLATSAIPQDVASIRELIDLARDMHRDSHQ
jgi:hypothetical protein